MRTADTGTEWPTGTGARRAVIGLTAVLVAGVDLGAKAWAISALRDRVIGLGPLDLRLGYNSGVAFSIGADAASWLVVGVTGAITTVVAVLAWRAATMGARAQHVGLALVLGGAVANLVDRAGDGVVTDYLHTGWWPTFNLADVAIVTGALVLVVASLRQPDDHSRARRLRSRKRPRAVPADAGELHRRIEAGEWVVDLRERAAYAAGHVRGTVNFGQDGSFITSLGWLLPWGTPETLLAGGVDKVEAAQRDLARIGIDRPAASRLV